ncbi:MAG TPA: hypothetical protein VMF66_05135 [Candidatus Acidoferrum sp.]|nr:hypothetical protein [Candidatus Acidoferrum sp.]
MIAALTTISAIALGGFGNPFGRTFVSTIVPVLIVFNSISWLLLRVRLGWRIVGLLLSASAAIALLLSYSFWRRIDFAEFAVILILGATAHLALLLLTSGRDMTVMRIVLASHVGTIFVIFVGLYLLSAGINFPDLFANRCLFWFPLTAMVLSMSRSPTGWRNSTRVGFLLALAATGVGLMEIGLDEKIAWMDVSASVVWLAAFALTIRWAGRLNSNLGRIP